MWEKQEEWYREKQRPEGQVQKSGNDLKRGGREVQWKILFLPSLKTLEKIFHWGVYGLNLRDWILHCNKMVLDIRTEIHTWWHLSLKSLLLINSSLLGLAMTVLYTGDKLVVFNQTAWFVSYIIHGIMLLTFINLLLHSTSPDLSWWGSVIIYSREQEGEQWEMCRQHSWLSVNRISVTEGKKNSFRSVPV